jgi:hypothetical protein
MTARWPIAGGAGALVAVVLASYFVQPGASRSGQVVFLQDVGPVESTADHLGGSVILAACVKTAEGLRVTGRVVSEDEVAVVVVSPGEEGRAGRAVGLAEAVSSSRFPGAAPGDFELVLGWASQSSTFAVVDGASLGPGPAPVRVGPTTRCPVTR